MFLIVSTVLPCASASFLMSSSSVGTNSCSGGSRKRIVTGQPSRASYRLLEVALLIRKDLIQSCFSLFYGIRADHLTECSDSVFLEEHMLGTAKTDTFCAQLAWLSSHLPVYPHWYEPSVVLNLSAHAITRPNVTSDRSVYSRDLARRRCYRLYRQWR